MTSMTDVALLMRRKDKARVTKAAEGCAGVYSGVQKD
jgi:hypothetical protein